MPAFTDDVGERRDWITDLGILVVGLAAAILTFTTLRGLAETVGFRDELFGALQSAWLLPVTIDAAGVIAARVWLRGTAAREAVEFARKLTWVCIGSSVVGNAGQHVMAEFAMNPPWWVVVLVTAVPPAMLGAVVHLGNLVRRPLSAQPPASPPDGRDRADGPADEINSAALDVEAARLYEAAQAQWAAAGGAVSARADEQADPDELPDRRAEVAVSRDAAIIDDLRCLEEQTGRRYSRDDVKTMYGIGSERARRLLLYIGWFPRAVQADERAEEAAR